MSTKSRSKNVSSKDKQSDGSRSRASERQRNLTPVQTSPSASSLSDVFSSPDESELSPISPPVTTGKINKWKADPKRRRFKLLRSFTMADFVTLGQTQQQQQQQHQQAAQGAKRMQPNSKGNV
jgi:hypothetical protein